MKEINKKLMAVQQQLRAPKSQYNEFNKFNYRNAEDILEAVKPILATQGLTLVLSDQMEYIGNRYYIKATATLSDGEDTITATAYAREDESRAGMSESQVTGCSSSYARKYCLNGLFCIDDGKDSDSFNNRKEQPSQHQPAKPAETKPQKTNRDILTEFCAEMKTVDSLHFHLARHYYAMTLLNKANVPVTTLQRCLGHKSIAMSMHYAHAAEKTIVQNVTKAFA